MTHTNTTADSVSVLREALNFAADTIELFDDATMQANHMLDAGECAAIIRTLPDSPGIQALAVEYAQPVGEPFGYFYVDSSDIPYPGSGFSRRKPADGLYETVTPLYAAPVCTPVQAAPALSADVLLEVIRTVRNYPDFDSDESPFGVMLDEALAGKVPALLGAIDSLANGTKPAPAVQAAPIDKLLTIIASAYQIAGSHDAPAHILDVLSDPEAATDAQVEAMLPYQAVQAAPVGGDMLKQARDALALMLDKRGYGCGEGSDHQVEAHNHKANEAARDAIAAIEAAPVAPEVKQDAIARSALLDDADKMLAKFVPNKMADPDFKQDASALPPLPKTRGYVGNKATYDEEDLIAYVLSDRAARQPSAASIGDDAEFVGLALAWEGSCEKETQTETWNALIDYIDARPPVAAPTDEQLHEDGVAKLMASADAPTEAPPDSNGCTTNPLDDQKASDLAIKPDSARDAALVTQGMADCMDMVRSELIEAGIIDKTTAPMFVANAVCTHIASLRAAPESAEPSADSIRDLLAAHAEYLDQNDYAYFELARTRRTGWMAWICSNHNEVDPDRKVIARGQGSTPDEACRDALATSSAAKGAGDGN